MRHRLIPGRRVLAVAALAPLGSLLTSRLLAMGIGAAGLSRSLPSGVHTYEPAVNLVGIDVLVLLSVLLALVGLALLATSARSSRGRLRAVLESAGVLVVAQLIFYVAQALLVAQVQGLPDAGPVIAVAMVLQAAVVLVALTTTAAAALVLPDIALPGPRPARFRAAPARLLPALVPVPVLLTGGTSRRGPPRSLSN